MCSVSAVHRHPAITGAADGYTPGGEQAAMVGIRHDQVLHWGGDCCRCLAGFVDVAGSVKRQETRGCCIAGREAGHRHGEELASFFWRNVADYWSVPRLPDREQNIQVAA